MIFTATNDDDNRICPLFSLGALGGQNYNGKPMVCEGCRCALWRWYDPPEGQHRRVGAIANDNPTAYNQPAEHALASKGYKFVAYDPKTGVPAHWLPGDEPAVLTRRGFCGLGQWPDIPT